MSLKQKLSTLITDFNIDSKYGQFLSGSKSVHTNFFTPPVIKLFSWREEDYQGSIFVVYKYNFDGNDYFITLNGSFGSCSGCDNFLDIESASELAEKVYKIYEKSIIYDNINDITFSEYTHPECVEKFEQFKKINNY